MYTTSTATSARVLSRASALAVLLLAAASSRADESRKPESLRWRKTYADALQEGRVRNLPVLVTRQKDG